MLFERAFAVGTKIHVVGQQHGQLLFRYGHRTAFFAVNYGYGRAPISLTRNKPIAQTVIHFQFALVFTRQLFHNRAASLLACHAVEFAAVCHDSVFGEGQLVLSLRAANDAFNRQAVLLGEHEIPFVVGGHSHNAARAVGVEHVVADKYRHSVAVYRVEGVSPRENARFFFCGGKSLYFVDLGCFKTVFLDGLPAVGRGNLVDKRMLGRENDVCHAEKRVGARRKHAESVPVGIVDDKFYFAALRPAYPVFLHQLGLFRPVQRVKTVQQLLRVVGNFEKPLSKVLFHHRAVATLAFAV